MGSDGSDGSDGGEQRYFDQIAAAYAVLGDPVKRKGYDKANFMVNLFLNLQNTSNTEIYEYWKSRKDPTITTTDIPTTTPTPFHIYKGLSLIGKSHSH